MPSSAFLYWPARVSNRAQAGSARSRAIPALLGPSCFFARMLGWRPDGSTLARSGPH